MPIVDSCFSSILQDRRHECLQKEQGLLKDTGVLILGNGASNDGFHAIV